MALDQAVKWGDVPRNVAAASLNPKLTQREGRAMSSDQVRTLLQTIRGHRFEAAYMTAGFSAFGSAGSCWASGGQTWTFESPFLP